MNEISYLPFMSSSLAYIMFVWFVSKLKQDNSNCISSPFFGLIFEWARYQRRVVNEMNVFVVVQRARGGGLKAMGSFESDSEWTQRTVKAEAAAAKDDPLLPFFFIQ